MRIHRSLGAALLALTAARGGTAHADTLRMDTAVTRWNDVALEVLPADPGLVLDARALAILHASVHDAVNAIERRYQPYTLNASAPGASLDAAVAKAAHDVLIALSPSQQARIEQAYAAELASIPAGPAREAGLQLGKKCADANLARRADDGVDGIAEPVYVPLGEPGDYAFTPPFDVPPLGPLALYPGFGRVTPFAIDLEQHRLPGPDSLASLRYALDFNYVKSVGRVDSQVRTPEQTQIAFFWFEFSPIGWNRIANGILRRQHVDAWKAARVLALVNFALADGYVAGFEEKYRHRFWRPYTAIRRADTDENPLTQPDPDWQPLFSSQAFFIPPVPDYPSTHTVLGAAAAEVLIRSFGDHVGFETTSTTLPGVVRRYGSFTQAAIENGLSRVYGGIHFLRAVRDGYAQGKGIGRAVSRLLPRVDY